MAGADDAASSGFLGAVQGNLGHKLSTTLPLTRVGSWAFPPIPPGAPTTFMLVPFPISTPAPTASSFEGPALGAAILLLMAAVWLLPRVLMSSSCCCLCCRRWLSRQTSHYFICGLVMNVLALAFIVTYVPEISPNAAFFSLVTVVGGITDELEGVLIDAAILCGAVLLFLLRKNLIAVLGMDMQFVKADLRDFLTCFSMRRFRVIEISVLRVQSLPASMTTRTLYIRTVLGFNEPQHTRPHSDCTNSFKVRERMRLNYDPEDDTKTLSIMVKSQEIVGHAAADVAPLFGALGGVALGPSLTVGAAAGAVTGIGVANSFGGMIARADLSSAMINNFTSVFKRVGPGDKTVADSATMWSEDNFKKIDLIPEGEMWLRIAYCDD